MRLLAVRAPALADDNAPAPRPAVPPDIRVSSAELKEIVARELAFEHLDKCVDVFDGV